MTTVPHDEALDTILSLGEEATVGEYRVAVDTGRWWWSDEVYRIHGFEPGEVVPTSELVLAHNHPQDRDRTRQVLDDAQCTDHPFAIIHRIVDAQGNGHVVSTVGQGSCDDEGRVTELRGYMLDLTTSVRQFASQEADLSIQAAARSRRDIEQAKGVLMVVLGVDDDEAFAILRRLSNDSNTPLRLLANWLMTSARETGEPSRENVVELLRSLAGGDAVLPD